jgi:hypothetical protein
MGDAERHQCRNAVETNTHCKGSCGRLKGAKEITSEK